LCVALLGEVGAAVWGAD